MASVSLAAARRSVSKIDPDQPPGRGIPARLSAALARAHGQNRYGSAVRVADFQGRLQGMEILRIKIAGSAALLTVPVFLHGLRSDVGRVGNLLHANNAVVWHVELLRRTSYFQKPAKIPVAADRVKL